MSARMAAVALLLVACHHETPPPPVAPVAAPVAPAPPVVAPKPPEVDPAATALADGAPHSLAQLWAKRLATAYLAKAERPLKEAASEQLAHALGYVSLDEELAVWESLVAIAPVFDEVDFTFSPRGPKGALGEDYRTGLARDNARRLPVMRKVYATLGPRGRRGLTMWLEKGALLTALTKESAEAGVCPAPLGAGASGFTGYQDALAAVHCPNEPREPLPTEPSVDVATALATCIADMPRMTKVPDLAREAWFADVRTDDQIALCAGHAQTLAEEPKTGRAPIAAAFAAADAPTRAALQPFMLRVKAPIPPELAVPKPSKDPIESDKRRLVERVRKHFGVPDVVERIGASKKAKDGQPTNLRYYRFRASTGDRATLPSYEFVVGDEVGTKWDPTPGTLRAFLEEHIHDGRSISFFEYD